MLRPWILSLSTLALLTASASAQNVTVQGRLVVPLDPSVVPCAAGLNPLQLEHTDVYITSTTINLVPLVDSTVQIIGPLVPGPCTLVDAQVVNKAPYQLETCGGGALGCTARVNLTSSGGGQYGLFVSLNSGFFPISPATGTFLIDPPTSVLILAAPESASGFQQVDLLIPSDAALLVLTIRLQALRIPGGASGALQASTVDTIWTGTFTTPCHIPGC